MNSKIFSERELTRLNKLEEMCLCGKILTYYPREILRSLNTKTKSKKKVKNETKIWIEDDGRRN